MKLIYYIQEDLNQIKRLTAVLRDEFYSQKVDILSGASIGQHVQHILEFYLCLRNSQKTGMVCYDERKRDIRIETDRGFAQEIIENVISWLEQIPSDCALTLKVNFSASGNEEILLETSLFRELAYNLEHSIHHQALIKVGVTYLDSNEVVIKNFGVAAATVRHRSVSD